MWSCLQNRIICKMCNFCGGSSKIFQYEKTGLFANCNGIYVDGNNRLVALIAIFVTLYNKCEWFRDGVNAVFGGIPDFIKGVVDKIKGFMSFEWKLPKIKLPHFKASGSWSLVPPKFPKFSVDWYANGGILNSPTIFGMNGDRMMGGGEAGAEAVLPIDLLKTYIRDPIDDEGRWKYINDNAVVKMPSFNGEQLFRIKNKEKRDSGVSAELTPIFLDAKLYHLEIPSTVNTLSSESYLMELWNP